MGSYVIGNTSVPRTTGVSYRTRCEDEDSGNHVDPNGLVISRFRLPLSIMEGDNKATGFSRRIAISCPSNSSFSNWTNPLPVIAGNGTFATAARAASNPSKAHVSIPVILAELRDLPKLVQIGGRSILNKLGSGYLSYSFGWRPLYNDVMGMLNFASELERRKKNLVSLRRKGGLKARYTGRAKGNETDVVITRTHTTLESGLTTVTGVRTVASQRRRWATMRWVPTLPAFVLRDDSAMEKLFRRQILGIHSSQQLSNVWEALPWSWLIDYFGNVGDILEASNNSIATVKGGAVCVMTHVRHDDVHEAIQKPDWLNFPTGRGFTETKERYISSGLVLFDVSLPLIDSGKLANAVAVLAARSKAYRK